MAPERTLTPQTTLDSVHAREAAEHWAKKYHEMKRERDSESLQECAALYPDRDENKFTQQDLRKLINEALKQCSGKRGAVDSDSDDLRQQLARARLEADGQRQKAETLINERVELFDRVSKAEVGLTLLALKVDKFYSQCSALAHEADLLRQYQVRDLFEPVAFFETGKMVLGVANVEPSDLRRFMDNFIHMHISQGKTQAIHFLNRPPQCLPLRIDHPGQHGYWFCPLGVPEDDAPFELIVEGLPCQWMYLGTYTTKLLPGAEMKLSEWMVLDESTKTGHCKRMAAQLESLPLGQIPSQISQQEIKSRFDTGEWNVPCHSLRCVGFDAALSASLAALLAPVPATVRPSELIGQPDLCAEDLATPPSKARSVSNLPTGYNTPASAPRKDGKKAAIPTIIIPPLLGSKRPLAGTAGNSSKKARTQGTVPA
ncbi:hypothetical protein OF83DRAFT_1174441 [Amylostereum chailletii]|nr:hypothetical protein OF83DRAFT_1174441 [Amylostereum chailletii]